MESIRNRQTSSSSSSSSSQPLPKRPRSQTSPQQQSLQQLHPTTKSSSVQHHSNKLTHDQPTNGNTSNNSFANASNPSALLQYRSRAAPPPTISKPTWPQRYRNIVSILQKPELKRGLAKFVKEQELGDNTVPGGGQEMVMRVERVKELEQVIRRLAKGNSSWKDADDSNSDSDSEVEVEADETAQDERRDPGGDGKSYGENYLQRQKDQREKDLSFLLDLSLTLHWALKSRVDSLASPSAANQYSASPPRPPPPTSLLSLAPLLESLVRNGLSDQDFPDVDGVSKFPSNNGGEVKMVRNRFLDFKALAQGGAIEGNGGGLVCVMKSTAKAAARNHRKNGRMRVDLETKVLLASSKGFKPGSSNNSITDFQDSEIPTPLLVASFQSPKSLHMVMEYLPHGDLDSFLISANDGKRNGCGIGEGTIASHPGQLLEERYLLSFGRDMVEAIGWLHQLGIVHRDIKPANFLISPSGHLKLCDFAGSAPHSTFTSSELESVLPPSPRKQLKRDQRDPRDASWRPISSRRVLAYYLRFPCGTPDYMAPEVLKAAEERERIDNCGEEDEESEDDFEYGHGTDSEAENTISNSVSVDQELVRGGKLSTGLQEEENIKMKGPEKIKRNALGLPRSNSMPEGFEYSLSAVPRSSSYGSNISTGGRSRSRLEPLNPSSPTPNVSTFPRSRSYNEIASSSSPSTRRRARTRIERTANPVEPRADSGVGGIKGQKSKSNQMLPTSSSSSSSLNSRSSQRARTMIPISSSTSANSIKSIRSVASSSSASDVSRARNQGDYSFDTEIPSIDAQVPGSYGPEIDFWCLGLVLHECAYGKLPFVEPAEYTDRNKIAEYMQYAITNCETTFKLDESVPLSKEFQDLISSFICLPSKRLGRNSTDEVKKHAFFRGTDWSRVWKLEAAYIPNSGASAMNAEANASLAAPVLQRQIYESFVEEVPSFSKIFQGGADDFPEFPDPSFDQSYAAQVVQEAQMSMNQANVTEAEISEISISKTAIPPTPAVRAAYPSIPRATRGFQANRWAEVPLELVGFSYLPPPDAFESDSPSDDVSALLAPEARTIPETVSVPHLSSVAKPPVRFSGVPPSPIETSRFSGGPIASTPYGKAPNNFGQGFPSSTPYQSTPFNSGTVPRSLQRRAVEAAASRAEGMSSQFVTPLRKTSMPNITSAFMSTPAPNQAGDGACQTHVPPSPYPFPASAQRVISASGVPHPALRRNDLDRARSSTPGTGSMGSDSRCSGGSNAKREVSERDAYDDIMSAIKKSAIKSTKKVKPTFGAREKAVRKSNAANLLRRIREGQEGSKEGKSTSTKTFNSHPRPPLTHAATDSDLLPRVLPSNLPSNTSQNSNSLKAPQTRPGAVSAPPPGELHPLSVAPVRLGALGGALMGFRSNRPRPPPILTRRPPSPGSSGIARSSIDISSEDDLDSLGALSSPDEEKMPIPVLLACAVSEERTHGLNSNFSGSNIAIDSNQLKVGGRTSLRKQRSARQLLLKAQERATPTKPARAASPSLTVVFSERDIVLPPSGILEAMEELQSTSPERIEREIDRMEIDLPAWNDRDPKSKPRAASMMIRKEEAPNPKSYPVQDSSMLAVSSEMNRSRSIGRRKSAGELPRFERRTSSIGLAHDGNHKEGSQHHYIPQLGDISNSISVSSLEVVDDGKRMRRRSSREMLSEYRLGKPVSSGKNSPSPTLSSPSMSSLANVTEDAFFGRSDSSSNIPSASSNYNPSRSLRRASFANFGAIKSNQSQQPQQQKQQPLSTSQAIPRRGTSVSLREENRKATMIKDENPSSSSNSSKTQAVQSIEQEQIKSENLPPSRSKRSSKWEKLGAALGRGSNNNTSNDRNHSSTKVSSSSSSSCSGLSGTNQPAISSVKISSVPLPKRVRALANVGSDSSSNSNSNSNPDDTADMSLGTGIVHKFGKWDSELLGAGRQAEKLIAHLSADPHSRR